MKVTYEIISNDIRGGTIKINKDDESSIRIEQGEERIFLHENSAQEVIYALREIIGDK